MRRIVYAEGEDERVLRAVQTIVDDAIAQPILIGRREVIAAHIHDLGLRMSLESSVRVVDPAVEREMFAPLLTQYQGLVGRRGIPPGAAGRMLLTRPSVAAAMMLKAGLADAAVCGGSGDWWAQMANVLPLIPRRPEISRIYGLSCLILQGGALFICDTHMNIEPTAEQLAEMTVLAAETVQSFGITPKAALLSHSSFGGSNSASARRMRQALALIQARAPELEVDGEMHADAALDEAIRGRLVADSRLTGIANLLIMPNLDAANIAFNLVKAAAEGLPLGPLLLGMSQPIHVVVPSVTARGIVNISAFAAMEVNQQAAAG
jgi:malate dehydrogenase (oxaloacetate-decarboxylating)(NADP+)